MLSTLALALVVIGVILLILSVFGITAGFTPYGTHGAITLIVVGIILYIVVLALSGHTVGY